MSLNAVEPAQEVKRLQRCMSDLVSVLALPAIWSKGEPSRILETSLDALVQLLELDFLYAQARIASHEELIEVLRTAESDRVSNKRDEIRQSLRLWLGEDRPDDLPAVRRLIAGREVSILSLRLGIEGSLGLIVAGSQRPDFPQQAERLVMRVAANQLAIMLQHAQLLGEQRRIARELDQRVAQKTRELAAANAQLKEKESQARLIVDNIPGLIALMSPTGDIDMVNRQLLEYFGQTLEELRSWATNDTVHPEDLPHVIDVFSRSIAAGTPYEIVQRFKRSDGIYRWFQNRGFPLRDANGNIDRWCVLLADIEDRKRAEQELLRKEAFLAKAQRLSATGSFSWCVETDEITFSEEARRIFGFEPDALVTFELIATRVHPEDLPSLAERTDAARRASEGQDYEIRLLMPDGSIKYLHTNSNETRGFSGQREYIGAIQDVTQRRVAQESLNQARSELAHVSRVTSLSALTASMAHEINQPLSGIITNANTCLRMLNSNPPNVDGARETAKRTIRDGNRASDVITRLRALFSKKEVVAERVDLNEATREVIALLLDELQRNRATLHYEFADHLPIVKGDRMQLQQVILNLARNASDALSGIDDRPRRLLIRTEQVDENVCLSVQDSGIGFDPGIADRLFESFYTTKQSGMGIGLSVSRSIIEAHGGRLWATANNGPGATFAFSIPCERIQ
jgi:PAS domain S-box-containing protein